LYTDKTPSVRRTERSLLDCEVPLTGEGVGQAMRKPVLELMSAPLAHDNDFIPTTLYLCLGL